MKIFLRRNFLSKLTNNLLLYRQFYCQSIVYSEKCIYSENLRRELEDKWKNILSSPDNLNRKSSNGETSYILSMFPYPSGNLHMGHVRVYTISDSIARFQRMLGKTVIHPMGWDSFGLPAENAAIERGELPNVWTIKNIKKMKTQLKSLCCGFDWDRELSTSDPSYYKWTQYIFLKMFEAGLVYQKEAKVNWDPVDKTVLADEQIDENGKSWRSGALIEKRYLRQWYIKTTSYSKSLYDGLEEVDSDLWRDIISIQKHWIGECDGTKINFQLNGYGLKDVPDSITVFTKVPEAIYGISHIVLSKDHYLNNYKFYENGETDNIHNKYIKLSINVKNPLSQNDLPIYILNDENSEFDESRLGIPQLSDEDKEFCHKNSIDILKIFKTNDLENCQLINSGSLDGYSREEARLNVLHLLKECNAGGYQVSEKLRDWLISRQRYWGTPIPIVHCTKCGSQPVPLEQLPVVLPPIKELTGKGESLLKQNKEWLTVKCPKCGGLAERESDTMDTFVDSSWYFLRFVDPHNTSLPFSVEKIKQAMPIDLYIGGKEHAHMHLYYARFVHHFLHDKKMVSTREPFTDLLTQGMVMAKSYKLADSGKYIPLSDVDFTDKEAKQKNTGAKLIVEWEKMSKSKHNGVDPMIVLDECGVDSTRLAILSNVGPSSNRLWSEDGVLLGIDRWLTRIWKLINQVRDVKSDPSALLNRSTIETEESSLIELRNFTINEITHRMKRQFSLNTVISRLQKFSSKLTVLPADFMGKSEEFEKSLVSFIIMLHPFAPIITSEVWEHLRQTPHLTPQFWDFPLYLQPWPVVDEEYRPSLKVKKGNKSIFSIKLDLKFEELSKLTKKEAFSMVENHPEYLKHFENQTILQKQFLLEPFLRAEVSYKIQSASKNKNST